MGKAVGKNSWRKAGSERSKDFVKEKFHERKTPRAKAEETC